MYFSKNFAKTKESFIMESGTCEFTGPHRYQNLELCVNFCEDFETLEEAMTRCLELSECDGVTFAHKYWGDYKSKGFHHGYGYQLRKSIL